MAQLKQPGRSGEFFRFPLFCSNQTLSRLDDVHLPWGGHTALLGVLLQMLISPGNIFMETPRNNV